MADLNVCTMVGRVASDPEIKQVGDRMKMSFRIAIHNRGKDENGQWGDTTTFFTVEYWRQNFDTLTSILTKGKQVSISGALKVDAWTDRDGNKREKPFIDVSFLQLTGSASDAPRGADGAGSADDNMPF